MGWDKSWLLDIIQFDLIKKKIKKNKNGGPPQFQITLSQTLKFFLCSIHHLGPICSIAMHRMKIPIPAFDHALCMIWTPDGPKVAGFCPLLRKFL